MTAAQGPEVRVLGRDQVDQLLDVDHWAFAYDEVDLDTSYALDGFEWHRTLGAWLPDPATGRQRLGGVCTTYSRHVRVPGGADVPMAALSWVGVHPDLRRRRVLTALMGRQLDDARAAGEPLAGLYASEPGIYGRFGYGLATRAVRLEVGRGAALRDVPGSEEVVITSATLDEARHAVHVAACYAASRTRPGSVSETQHQMRQLFEDPPRHRVGAEPKRLLVATRAGQDPADGGWCGYAVLRRRVAPGAGAWDGEVSVHRLVAHDAAAARAMWGRLLDLDLTAKVTTDWRPVDDPLLHLLVDARAARPRVADAVWLRVLDVARALEARRYAAGVDLVLEVRDTFRPGWGGRWRLIAEAGATPSCAPSDDEPHLACEVRELGAAYLGGESWSALVGAGLVEERRAGAAAHADRAFSSPVAPFPGVAF